MGRNPKAASGGAPPKPSGAARSGGGGGGAPRSPAAAEPQPPLSPAAAALAAAAGDPLASGADPAAALKHLQSKRTDVAEQLRDVERQIYDLETKYLEGCNPSANALRGYEGLMSQPVQQYKKPAGHVRPEDRLFSGSSLTGWQHLPGAP
ncbi:hypothetical protein Rsub_00684 [Raphidocelis subcapitata]|uniref:Chromatin modification-related protein MEAF6 n=1 Tax=Raphidocelis subcapitata TaxID=307507 RepID=A0A2V0NNC0_9CHLO|nr:hypothetical protein Rsub_00684 [Raphidocelis subcapitata]|eukprot:GBF87972.1 hypothetical protein Rsub_00684 [Raphidocelis subcapitata]